MDDLQRMGFRGTILTYAKETVFDQKTNTQHGMGVATTEGEKSGKCKDVEAWRKGTLETVGLLKEGDQLAIK